MLCVGVPLEDLRKALSKKYESSDGSDEFKAWRDTNTITKANDKDFDDISKRI